MTHKWEGSDKIIVEEYVENVHELHPWKNPECYIVVEENGSVILVPNFTAECNKMLLREKEENLKLLDKIKNLF